LREQIIKLPQSQFDGLIQEAVEITSGLTSAYLELRGRQSVTLTFTQVKITELENRLSRAKLQVLVAQLDGML